MKENHVNAALLSCSNLGEASNVSKRERMITKKKIEKFEVVTSNKYMINLIWF